MLNIVCEGTTYQVCVLFGPGFGIPSASKVTEVFCMVWASWVGMPEHIWTDRGKEFMGAFSSTLSAHGVEVGSVALEVP